MVYFYLLLKPYYLIQISPTFLTKTAFSSPQSHCFYCHKKKNRFSPNCHKRNKVSSLAQTWCLWWSLSNPDKLKFSLSMLRIHHPFQYKGRNYLKVFVSFKAFLMQQNHPACLRPSSYVAFLLCRIQFN